MCVAAERVAAALSPAAMLPPAAASDMPAGGSGMNKRTCVSAGDQPPCKRATGTDTCADRAQQRMRRSACSDGQQIGAPADVADQQQEPAAERDSDRSRGGRHKKQSDIGGVSGTAAGVPARVRAVMAGTGEVLAADMNDSTALYEQRDWHSLRSRLQQDGYLVLRGILPACDVLKARTFLLEKLHEAKPHCFAPGVPCSEARAAEGAGSLGLLARQDLAAAPPVAAVLEAAPLFSLMRSLLQSQDVVTSGYKWLRAVGHAEFTGLHTDRVFLGRGTPRLLTAWMPLGALPPEQGSLLVAAGSHRLPEFATLRAGYGQSQVGKDGTRSGWLTDNGASLAGQVGAAAVDWRVANCMPGDVVVLGLDVLHMSASNESSPPCIRLSCDTRWQPADEQRDPRLAVWRDAADCVVAS